MPKISVVQADITSVTAEALVNATNTSLLAGGDRGVNGAIHLKGGKEVFEACKKIRIQLGEIPVGEAITTPAGRLSAKHIIHAVGPVWQGGKNHEAELLAQVYENVFQQAEKFEVKSLAIPNISTGIYGFPKEEAAKIAFKAIENHFSQKADSSLSEVLLVCRNDENFRLYQSLLPTHAE